MLAIAGTAIASMVLAEIAKPVPRLVWNASASLPVGMYRVTIGGEVGIGDLVLVRLPEHARKLADERGYLPADVPLVKRVAGVGGNVVCVADRVVRINGRPVAEILAADRSGRELVPWKGCRALEIEELFLLIEDVRGSFDSRYFGPVERSAVIGRVSPLWTW